MIKTLFVYTDKRCGKLESTQSTLRFPRVSRVIGSVYSIEAKENVGKSRFGSKRENTREIISRIFRDFADSSAASKDCRECRRDFALFLPPVSFSRIRANGIHDGRIARSIRLSDATNDISENRVSMNASSVRPSVRHGTSIDIRSRYISRLPFCGR